MATLSIVSTTTSSVKMKIVELDAGWASGERYAHWYISSEGYSTSSSDYDGMMTLADGITESDSYTFSMLDADTRYYISCVIKRGDTGATIITLTEYADTEAEEAEPDLSLTVRTTEETLGARVWGLSTVHNGEILYCHFYSMQKGTGIWVYDGVEEVDDETVDYSPYHYYSDLEYGESYYLRIVVKYASGGTAGAVESSAAYSMPDAPALNLPFFSVQPVTETTAYINISNLGNVFSEEYYQLVGVTTGYFSTQGAATIPDTVLGTKAAPITNDVYSTGFQVAGLTPGTEYTVYCFAQAANGKYYAISNSQTEEAYGIDFVTLSVGRPEDWQWTVTELLALENQGETSEIAIQRWNAFLDRVNEFADYVNAMEGMSYAKIPATNYMDTSGDLYAADFSAAAQVVSNLSGISTGYPVAAGTDDEVYGSYLIAMADALNSIK